MRNVFWGTILYKYYKLERVQVMVLILDGNSEIGAQVRSNLCYLIWLRLSIISEQIRKDLFLSAFATCSEWPSNILSVSYITANLYCLAHATYLVIYISSPHVFGRSVDIASPHLGGAHTNLHNEPKLCAKFGLTKFVFLIYASASDLNPLCKYIRIRVLGLKKIECIFKMLLEWSVC